MKAESSQNSELLAFLVEQVAFLKRSAAAYDEGFKSEAKRLGVVVRVLVHDTGQSRSLLSLVRKKTIRFLDTSVPPNPRNLLSHQGLTLMSLGPSGAEYVPRCLAPPNPMLPPPRWVGIIDWWRGVVLLDEAKRAFSRKDLVLALANKEGGAHVDTRLDAQYAALSRHFSMGWWFSTESSTEPVADIELACVRQIAHEVIASLERAFPAIST